jgi:hypothetical protein
MLVVERTAMPDGTVTEDKGQMTRVKQRPSTASRAPLF